MVGTNSIAWMNSPEKFPARTPGWAASLMADKGNLLLMLYDKALRCMEEAVDLIDTGDMILKGERLIKAQDIVLQLSDALDRDNPDENTSLMAFNLERLYLYIYRRLIRGNNYLDKEAIREAHGLLNTLYQAWEQIILGTNSANKPMVADA